MTKHLSIGVLVGGGGGGHVGGLGIVHVAVVVWSGAVVPQWRVDPR